MLTKKWRVHTRTHQNLLEHLCQIREIPLIDLRLDFTTQLHDPNLLPGMKAARQLVVRAKSNNWPVTIFGDYDADGTPAAALPQTVLERLGFQPRVIIPTRDAGYGLKVA